MIDFLHEVDTSQLIYILDIIGVAAAAAAASVLAKRVGLDALGAIMIAVAGSIGGGTTRDLLLNRHPLFWLHQLSYLYVIIIVALVVQVFYHTFEKLDKPIRLFDAIGLAAFSVIGFNAAQTLGHAPIIVVMMGVITSVVGGIVRDITCAQIPLVLRQDIYMMASVIGGVLYLGLIALNTPIVVREILTMVVIFVIRMLAIYRHWNLPSITINQFRK